MLCTRSTNLDRAVGRKATTLPLSRWNVLIYNLTHDSGAQSQKAWLTGFLKTYIATNYVKAPRQQIYGNLKYMVYHKPH